MLAIFGLFLAINLVKVDPFWDPSVDVNIVYRVRHPNLKKSESNY